MNAKRSVTIKRTIDPVAETILFVPYDREGKLIVGEGLSCHFEAKKCANANRHMAMMMGYNHSIGDEAAKVSGTSLKEKFAAMNERARYLESGADAWTTGRGPTETGLLFRAMGIAYPSWNPEKIQKFIAEQKEKAKKLEITWTTMQSKLLRSEKLAAIVEQLRAEEADAAKVDVDALFEELDAE